MVAQTIASDNCSVTVTQNPEAGTVISSLHSQDHVVEITATDGSGNTASCSVTLTAQDVTAPVIEFCALSQDVNLDSDCGLVVPNLVDQTTASDNCTVNVEQTPTAGTVLSSAHNATHTVVITATDAAGNSVECSVTLTGKDVTAPEISCVNDQARSTNAGLCSYVVVGNEFDPISFDDNCSGSSISNDYNNSNTLAGAIFNKGTTTVTWTATDLAGNTTSCSFDVTINDNELPTIECAADITATVNATSCSAAVYYDVTFNDNCPDAELTQTTGLASGSDFPLGVTVNTFVVTDASGNTATCSFTVTVGTTLTVDAGSDEQTFFGYNADQTVVRTAVASGGTAPYTYAWTLSRPLVCNFVNTAGDETFAAGSCVNNTCPTTGSPSVAPSCSGSATVTATLIQDAELCVTVTDAFGCTYTDCFTIGAEDARCFAGNSNIQKVNICHKTSSTKNPWVQICIAQSAVPAHLSANDQDYVGMCGSRLDEEDIIAAGSGSFAMSVYPNPARENVLIEFETVTAEVYQLELVDITGRLVSASVGNTFEGGNRITLPVSDVTDGIYLMRLTLGDKTSTVRLVVTK